MLTLRLPALLLVALPTLARAQSLGAPPVPAENPITDAKSVLGKALFWDEQLSSDNTVACGTCHIPGAGGSDPRLDMGSRHPGLDGVFGGADDRFASAGVRRASTGGQLEPDAMFGFEAQVTGRRSPTTIAAAYFDELFWDGRATGAFDDPETGVPVIAAGGALENQSVEPILSSVEMADGGRTWDEVKSKLARVKPLALATDLTPDLVSAIGVNDTYPALFAAAFGDSAITARRIAFALATYQRTLVPNKTPWDLHQSGVSGAMTSQQISGMNAFMSNGLRCAECHAPPLFSDGSYRNLGLRDIAEDDGRRGITGLSSDRGKFKVPTLRNAGLRTRYFHHGDPTHESLFLAVFLYNQGAGFFLDNKDPLLNNILFSPSTALNITEFIQGALTDPRVEAELSPFDRPTLWSEAGAGVALSGVARPGTAGFRPRIIAHTPAKIGTGELRVAVSEGFGGASAVLAMRTAAPAPPAGGGGGFQSARTPSRVVHSTILEGSGAGGGYGTWSTELPDDPALVGTELWFRWVVRDPGSVMSRAASRWAQLTVF